jgi:hypothetical protein
MVFVYYLTGADIDKVESHPTWEDAYIFIAHYAEKHDYELCFDGAVKKETNQFLKIYK